MLLDLNASAEVRRHLLMPNPPTIGEVSAEMIPSMLRRSDFEAGYGFWVATLRATGEEIGWFHLYLVPTLPEAASLGYRLTPRHWGQGLATEGSRALVDHAFGLPRLERVVASALPGNGASIRVMEKIGLLFSRLYSHSTGDTLVEYAISRDAWLRRLASPG